MQATYQKVVVEELSSIMCNVCNTLALVKQPRCNEELFLKNASLQMLLNSKENMPISKVSRVLKVSRRTLFKARSRQEKPGVDARLFSLAACHKKKIVALSQMSLKKWSTPFGERRLVFHPTRRMFVESEWGGKAT